MQLSEIEDNIVSRRNRIFLLMEEVRRLRIQRRLKVKAPAQVPLWSRGTIGRRLNLLENAQRPLTLHPVFRFCHLILLHGWCALAMRWDTAFTLRSLSTSTPSPTTD